MSSNDTARPGKIGLLASNTVVAEGHVDFLAGATASQDVVIPIPATLPPDAVALLVVRNDSTSRAVTVVPKINITWEDDTDTSTALIATADILSVAAESTGLQHVRSLLRGTGTTLTITPASADSNAFSVYWQIIR